LSNFHPHKINKLCVFWFFDQSGKFEESDIFTGDYSKQKLSDSIINSEMKLPSGNVNLAFSMCEKQVIMLK